MFDLLMLGMPLFFIIFLIGLLIFFLSAAKKRPDEHLVIQTQKNVQELADQIQRVVGELGANIDKIQDDPLGNYGMKYEVAVVLSGKSHDFIGSNWAVQIFIVDAGDVRHIELVAISERPSAEYYGGIKISESRAKCELIASRLR